MSQTPKLWVLWILLPLGILTDIIQVILDFFAIGVVVNRMIDIFVALILLPAFWLSGVSDRAALLILGAALVGEELPVVDVMPFWTLDIWYTFHRARTKHQAEETTQTQNDQTLTPEPAWKRF